MTIIHKYLGHLILVVSVLSVTTVVKAAEAKSSPILIAMGGHGSCSQDSSVSQWNILGYLRGTLSQRTAQRALTYPWIASCYDGSQLWMFSSKTIPGASTIDGYINNLVMQRKETPTLIFVGHSWGGMLAIETAVKMKAAFKQRATIPGNEYLKSAKIFLATIDPIDFHYCTERGVLLNGNCRSAPPSLWINNRALTKQVQSSVDGWLNIYQVDGPILHSGPIYSQPGELAIENILLDESRWTVPHNGLIQDGYTWGTITDRAAKLLAL